MTERELMAQKYANTPFACLFHTGPVSPPLTEKQIAQKEKRKRNNDIQNAKRKSTGASPIFCKGQVSRLPDNA